MAAFQLRDAGVLAQVRLGAVVRARGRVLLHRPMDDGGPWAVPGGRLEIGETAREGLAREFVEELGVEVVVGELLCTIENFFEHWPLGEEPPAISHHELGLYFAVDVPTSLAEATTVEGVEAAGTPDERRLAFAWVPVGEIDELDVRPTGLLPYLVADGSPAGGFVTVR